MTSLKRRHKCAFSIIAERESLDLDDQAILELIQLDRLSERSVEFDDDVQTFIDFARQLQEDEDMT